MVSLDPQVLCGRLQAADQQILSLTLTLSLSLCLSHTHTHAHTHTVPRGFVGNVNRTGPAVKPECPSVSSKQVKVGMLTCASLNLQKH